MTPEDSGKERDIINNPIGQEKATDNKQGSIGG
jgi:hypothetical protein